MRLFFAVELPPEVRAALAALAPDSPEYRGSSPDQLHVTLAFLGEQPATALPALERAAAAAVRTFTAGTLSLGAAGGFGPRRAPRVLWIGLAGDVDRLTSLHARLARELEHAGVTLEARPFQPHITLARRRPTAGSSAPAWPPPSVPRMAFPLRSLVLFESKLSPRGARYVPLREFPLEYDEGT